ncbi:unnamed protein product [Zymoseptoria tritici ST99CH_3D1]|nr:unnamed protein product [Zymoseptoria tritici ST99CH_3D1]
MKLTGASALAIFIAAAYAAPTGPPAAALEARVDGNANGYNPTPRPYIPSNGDKIPATAAVARSALSLLNANGYNPTPHPFDPNNGSPPSHGGGGPLRALAARIAGGPVWNDPNNPDGRGHGGHGGDGGSPRALAARDPHDGHSPST